NPNASPAFYSAPSLHPSSRHQRRRRLPFGSHSKKRPNNLVFGRMFDHHIYDLVEVGVDNFRPIESFEYDKKLTPRIGSKPFFAFVGDGFESVEELKHLKEVLLDLFRGEVVQVVENLNLAGIDHVFVCTALSSSTVFFTHCALRLKRSGTAIPRMELVEVGPSMDLVVRRHRLPNDSLKKEAMKTTSGQPKKKVCASHLSPKSKGWFFPLVLVGVQEVIIINNGSFVLLFKVGGIALSNDVKGLKRERREARKTKVVGENEAKKRKKASE
ncbi:hypothetical protein GW17_00041577, partial [Ensete ventricosum]